MTLMLTWPLLGAPLPVCADKGRAKWSAPEPSDALGASGAPRLHAANAAAAAQTATVLQTNFMVILLTTGNRISPLSTS